MLNRPDSRLAQQMDYYVTPVDDETNFRAINSPEELKIIDPACGSGHMLTYAFDLLYLIYEEEGYSPSEIPGLILANNLYGTEIDPRAAALAAFALMMKARARQRTFFNKLVEPKVCVLEPIHFAPQELDLLLTPSGDRDAEIAFWSQFEDADTVGSLIRPGLETLDRIRHHFPQLDHGGDLLHAEVFDRAERVVRQAEYLAARYSVVVANPPYMGTKSMNGVLADFAKKQFKDSKSDLFAMFIERCLGLADDRGLVGMITMRSWMFGSTLGQLRTSILATAAVRNLAHLGAGAFDTITGEVVSTAAFVLEKTDMPLTRFGAFVDLTQPTSEAGKRECLLQAISDGGQIFRVPMSSFAAIPGHPIAYWAADEALAAFRAYPPLSTRAELKAGISTGDNPTFERQWYEVALSGISRVGSRDAIGTTRWTPCNSGGRFRRWYGNNEVVMDWENGGSRIRSHTGSAVRNPSYMGRGGLTYSKIGGARFAVRTVLPGFVFDDTGRMIFPNEYEEAMALSALLNSSTCQYFLDLMSPGISFTSAEIGKIPCAPMQVDRLSTLAEQATEIAKKDWDSTELSWDFQRPSLMGHSSGAFNQLRDVVEAYASASLETVGELRVIEEEINKSVAAAYGLEGVVETAVPDSAIALGANPRFSQDLDEDGVKTQIAADACRNLVSYAVGCMFGRYSLDKPGLIVADEGVTVQDYLAKISGPTFAPDSDNVLPVVDGDWFEDDIVTRFRQFLRAAFGERHFEENLRFVTEALGVRDLRDYFVKSFYKDHVQRYKKRPIYWLFSSPKGSFNALIYMHRYTPSTVSTVLNEYLREFKAKLEATLAQQERLAAGGGTSRQQAAAQKEADRIRKMLLELNEYEHDVLYPLASQQIVIDLDDGVKVNYRKFGAALKKIPGLEAGE